MEESDYRKSLIANLRELNALFRLAHGETIRAQLLEVLDEKS